MLTKTDLETAARMLMRDADVSTHSLDSPTHWMTITTFICDTCLNEIERRGALVFVSGHPSLPYNRDHFVETVLRRDQAIDPDSLSPAELVR